MSAFTAYTFSLDIHLDDQSMDSQLQDTMQSLGAENIEAGFHSGWLASFEGTQLRRYQDPEPFIVPLPSFFIRYL